MASVTLGDHYERLIQSLVESGRYSTTSEVVRDSLRLLEERERMRDERLRALRALIAEGDESGEPELLDIERIKAEARAARQRRMA